VAGPHQREEDRRVSAGEAEVSPAPVAEEAPFEAHALPNRIGRFAVLQLLGSGGMGLVCAAYDAELDRKVAIKLLRPQIAQSGKSNLAQARLLREAQALARLAHPNIVTVHEVGTFGDQVFIAMEFLYGVTLKQWLRRARRPWRRVLDVFIQAGHGLAAAHSAGLIHRDFKPDNVMVTEDPRNGRVERVRVFDFGVVQESREAALRYSSQNNLMRTPSPDGRRVSTPEPEPRQLHRSGDDLALRTGETDPLRTPAEPLRRAMSRSLPPQEPGHRESQEATPPTTAVCPGPPDSASLHGDEIYTTGLTKAGALVGTPLYMAPEQYEQVADARSDQFSFCAALYEALYRRRPFGGDTPARIQQAKRAGTVRRPPRNNDVPAWLHRIVMRGLQAEPGRRYPTMEALLADLERDRSRGRPLAVLALAAALGLFVLGGALAWSVAPGRPEPCAAAASGLLAVWSPARREQIRAAFRNSGRPHAEMTWAAVDARLDAYAQTWIDQRVGLCEAADEPRPEAQAAPRGLCLEHRLFELGALVDLLERADGEVVDNAVQAVAQLQPVVICRDVEAFFARTPPPPPLEAETQALALERRLADVRALEQTGKYAAGLDQVTVVLRDARALGHAPLIAEAQFWQGLLHSRVSAPRSAEAALREAALIAQESRHDAIFARAATELARVVGVELERHAEGVMWSDLASAALRRVDDPAGEVTRRGYLGHLHEVRGDLQAAQAQYGEALVLARNTFPEEHPQVATALDDLAGMQLRHGDYAAAQAGYEKVLQIRQATQGPGHPRVAEALGHLGRCAFEQGQHDRARGLFEQALGICDTLRACSPGDRAEALLNLGRAEYAVGRFAAAQVMHEEALQLYDALYDGEHTRVATLLLSLGVFARRQGRFDEAAGYYQRALAILRRLRADDHPDMAALHVNIGDLAMARGRLDEARVAFERALAIHEKRSGFENFGLAEMLDNLGVIALAQGRAPDALALHTRARQIFRRNLDEHHPDVVRVTLHLAEALLASGDPNAAEAALEPSLRAQEEQQPPPTTLSTTYFLLARALARGRGVEATRRQRARSLAERALAAERVVPGHDAAVAAISTWLRAQPTR